MSDEIIDVTSEHIDNIPIERKTKEGMNVPDPTIVDDISPEGLKEIEARRCEVASLPEYPSEWQEGYKDEDTKGFDDNLKLPVTATIKQDEINKLIKKYKRYMKSNIREIRRVENDV